MPFTLELGAAAADFDLPGVDGANHRLTEYASALVVIFTCNHCPYAIGSEDRIMALHDDYAARGVRLVAISSNETIGHLTDSFEHMVTRAKEKNFPFDYLFDESQDVARAYGALRTPHFFLFDGDGALVYTGRMDDNPRDAAAATTHELRDAIDAVLSGATIAEPLTNPLGCNVKWKDQDAHWMPPEACDLI
jgi:peroxiredoxin